MLSLADAAACLTVSLFVRIWASMLRRMLPFSTLTQFFAVGTTQAREADFSPTVFPSRLFVLGMVPSARIAVIDELLVYSLIQSTAACLFAPIGTPRFDPPWKLGMN